MNNIATKNTLQVAARPAVQWVMVRDTSGRPHLEMRWSVPGAQAPFARAA